MFVRLPPLAKRTAFRNPDVLFVAMTRFDVPVPKMPRMVEVLARGEMDAWTEERAAIFRRWCLPPMLGQSVRPHAWVILFDEDVKPASAALVEELRAHDFIVPLFLGPNWKKHLAATTTAALDDRFGAGAFRYVCCTRLDSDDSLHAGFHAAVDEAVAIWRGEGDPEAPVVLNFPFGVMQHGGSLYVRHLENLFFAMLEGHGSFRGPYVGTHTKIHEVAPVVHVFTDQPAYAYHRHDQTLSGGTDRPKFARIADPERVLRSFALVRQEAPMPRRPTPGTPIRYVERQPDGSVVVHHALSLDSRSVEPNRTPIDLVYVTADERTHGRGGGANVRVRTTVWHRDEATAVEADDPPDPLLSSYWEETG